MPLNRRSHYDSIYQHATSETIFKVEHLASCISTSLRQVLDNTASDHCFTGNEEKIFAWFILDALKYEDYEFNEGGMAPFKFSDAIRMLSIDFVCQRNNTRSRYSLLRSIARKLHSAWRSIRRHSHHRGNIFLNTMQIGLTLYHYSVFFDTQKNVTSNLTKMLLPGLHTVKVDPVLRMRFRDTLLEHNLTPNEANLIVSCFPRSHLECVPSLTSLDISQFSFCKTIITSVYGIMDDPVLSLCIARTRPHLIFIAHGGSYGFINSCLHNIEYKGCDLMLGWGSLDYNIKQTRFSIAQYVTPNNIVYLVMSVNASIDCINRAINTSLVIEKILGSINIRAAVALHPSSPFADLFPSLQCGINDNTHLNALLIIYDNLTHTLMWQRIANKLPFLVIDDPVALPQCEGAALFCELLVKSNLLIDPQDLTKVAVELISEMSVKGGMPPAHTRFSSLWRFYDRLPDVGQFLDDYNNI